MGAKRIGAILAASAILASQAYSVPTSSNGDFEAGTTPWKTQPQTPNECEPPFRAPGANSGVGGHRVAKLGPSHDSGGCNPSVVYQSFNCTGTGDYCTIEFQALLEAAGDFDKAFVNLGSVSKRIPVASGWQTYRISAPVCGQDTTIAFTFTGDLVDHQLTIDNVTQSCSTDDQTSGPLINESTPFAASESDPGLTDLHDVPDKEQDSANDCGPTAAASCMIWWQENGFPDLATREGGKSIDDFKSQLESDADTDPNRGTYVHKLVEAINRLVNEGSTGRGAGSTKGKVAAKGTLEAANLQNFDYLDDEFGKGEDVLILLTYRLGGQDVNHYVTVRKVSGSGSSRSVNAMNPATGATTTIPMSQDGGHLAVTYDGHPGRVLGFISVSPTTTVTGSSEPVNPENPSEGTKITYQVFFGFPVSYPDKEPKDLHVLVSDCVPGNYQVNGLPAGWLWKVEVASDGNCYVTMWSNGSDNALTNGHEIEVIYTGSDVVKVREESIITTNDGNDDPTTGQITRSSGPTVVANDFETPAAPGRPRAAVTAATPGSMDVMLVWDPSPTPEIAYYALYNDYSEELVATTPTTELEILGLPSDTVLSFSVVGVTVDGAPSQHSGSTVVHQDQMGAFDITAFVPGPLLFPPPLTSWHGVDTFVVEHPLPLTDGQFFVHTIGGLPYPAHPMQSRVLEPHWHFVTTAVHEPMPIPIVVPYAEQRLKGDESSLRLNYFDGSNWIDVTDGINVGADNIFGTLPQFGPVVLVDGAPTAAAIPAISTWGMVVMTLLVLSIGTIVLAPSGRVAVK